MIISITSFGEVWWGSKTDGWARKPSKLVMKVNKEVKRKPGSTQKKSACTQTHTISCWVAFLIWCSLYGGLEFCLANLIETERYIFSPDALLQVLRRALTKADIVVTSGGVSMGDKVKNKLSLGSADILFAFIYIASCAANCGSYLHVCW